jgi:hypothetical protein
MRFDHLDERRLYPRKALGANVQLRSSGVAVGVAVPCSHHSLSHDISATGMRIESDQFYLPNTRLLISVERESAGMLFITSRVVVVVWAKPLPARDKCLLGIRFSRRNIPISPV